MGKVRLEGHIEVPPDRIDLVKAALPLHIALTRAEPGCLSFNVTQSPDTPRHFLVSELFSDQAAFDRHQARTKASAWAEITSGMDRHYTITTDGSDSLAQTQGGPSLQERDQAPGLTGEVQYPIAQELKDRASAEGQPGLDWLTSLDRVLASLEQDWGITIGPALPGHATAFVAQASTADGEMAILKVNSPGAETGRHEAELLGHAAGKGYAQLLRHDPPRRAMLLEQLGDRLDTLDLPYGQQIDIICATLLKAWMPAPLDLPWPTGADKANSLAENILKLWSAASQPCSQAVIDTALMYCRDRAATYHPENAVLAHGNPRATNILVVPDTSNPVQFKFINPDGLAIEPAYDLGVLLRAWDDGISGRHAHDIARSHARHLTTRTQVPSEAIWQWGFIERVSSGLHLLSTGEHEKGRAYLDIAQAIVSTAG